nr:hypothetical protein [Clostridia bacterium]
MKEKLIQAHNELQQIFVRGIDSVHMANALVVLEQVIKELEEEKSEDKQEG